jgi:hypothetical protein
MRWFPDYK